MNKTSPGWRLIILPVLLACGCQQCCPPFCPPDGRRASVTARVTSALPSRERNGNDDAQRLQPEIEDWRREGHHRFFEVSFALGPGDAGDLGGEENRWGGQPLPLYDEREKASLLGVCSQASFFVDFPEGPVPPADFAERLAGELSRWVEQDERRRWLFQKPRPPAAAATGVCGVPPAASATMLNVQAGSLCTLLESLRTLSQRLTDRQDMEIGRICSFVPQGFEEQTCDAALTDVREWHTNQLGLPAAGAPQGGDALVRVALIDSGLVEPDLAALRTPPATGEPPRPDPYGGRPLALHGSAMALLIRQLAPQRQVQLHIYRVFDEYGQSTPNDVARALDHALFDLGRHNGHRDAPLVVNLSLGWPPELGRRRTIRGGLRTAPARYKECQFSEGPVGSAVHYLIRGSAQGDRTKGPVLVVAAAGNRPGFEQSGRDELFARSFGVEGQRDRRHPSWFYPAQYERDDDAPALPLVAGAVDDLDRPAVVGIPRAEAPIVAPGQHVFVSHPSECPHLPANLATTASPVCPHDPEEGGCNCPGLFLPETYSGSSLGAALISGAAARAQLLALQALQRPLSRPLLARLLHVSGVPVLDEAGAPRRDPVGRPVRRLSLARLDDFLGADLFRECVEPAGSGAAIFGGWPPACEQGAGSPMAAPRWLPAVPGTPPVLSTVPPPAVTQLPDWYSLAGLGPQPKEPACPCCSIVIAKVAGANPPQTRLTLYLQLQDYAKGTTFPWANVIIKSGASTTRTWLNSASWLPGQTLTFTVPGPSINVSGSETSALEMAVASGGPAVVDVSPLKVAFH